MSSNHLSFHLQNYDPLTNSASIPRAIPLQPAWGLVKLVDNESGKMRTDSIIRALFSLPPDYQVKTNCKSLDEIQFVGLGDVHNFEHVMQINTAIAKGILKCGDSILLEDTPDDETHMVEKKEIGKGISYASWDTDKDFSEFYFLMIETCIILQRLKYTIKRSNQFVFHKKNKAHDSFSEIAKSTKEILSNYSKNQLKSIFREELKDKKSPDREFFVKQINKLSSDSENPWAICDKCLFLLTLAKRFLDNSIDDSFCQRQNSLIKVASTTLRSSRRVVAIAGLSHLYSPKSGEIEARLSQYFQDQNIPYLLISPKSRNRINRTRISPLDSIRSSLRIPTHMPKNLDFTTNFGNKGYSNIDFFRISALRFESVWDLCHLYERDGSLKQRI